MSDFRAEDWHNHYKEQLKLEKKAKKPPRSQWNEWAKFVVSQANFLFVVMGLLIISGALYVLAADFGDLDKGFFLGGGAIVFLFGCMLLMVSYLGGQGIYYQRRESKHTMWQGRRILIVYQVCLIMTLIFELVWLGISLAAITELRNNAEDIQDDPDNPPEWSSMEIKISQKFDAFFFGASSQCNTLKYLWFWNFVNKRCTKYNENMSQFTCQRCNDASVTSCAGDERTCYENGQTQANDACPYNACRRGVLEFVLDRFSPFAYFVLFVVIFQVFLIACTCTLICYHPRDSELEIRAKNGIFAQQSPKGPGPDNHEHHHHGPPPRGHPRGPPRGHPRGPPRGGPRGMPMPRGGGDGHHLPYHHQQRPPRPPGARGHPRGAPRGAPRGHPRGPPH